MIMGNVLGKAATVDFCIQWGMFLLAAYLKTEKFFDATGSATFLVLVLQSLLHTRRFFPRQVVQSGLVATWATRLGLFLVTRVLRDGRDSRFNRVRDNPRRFFIYWTVQGALCETSRASVINLSVPLLRVYSNQPFYYPKKLSLMNCTVVTNNISSIEIIQYTESMYVVLILVQCHNTISMAA